MKEHPNYVFIPASTAEGVRAYREPAIAHPLQLAFLNPAGERAYVEHVRALLSAGRLDEADALLMRDLDGFDGRMAQLCHATTRQSVTVEGWDDLLPILDEYEGPSITAITVGLTNDSDLVFDHAAEHEPALVVALYSDDSYAFSRNAAETILGECLSDYPAFAGADEDIEFYAVSAGLAPLNTALIQSKHRYFLRDGRDGVDDRAPGGYVEYILGTWLRALRFLQALRSAAGSSGIPAGARLIAGTTDLNTDLACVLGEGAGVEPAAAVAAPIAAAALTMKKWVPKIDPLAEAFEPGSALRRKIAEPLHAAEPTLIPEPVAVTAIEPVPRVEQTSLPFTPPERKRGLFARLFARLRRAT
ncbi:MAG: hypothetical protein ABIO29_02060 [Sphingomicrobium sp.]